MMTAEEKLEKCLDFLKRNTYDSFGEDEEYGHGQDYVDAITGFYNWITQQ